MTRNPWLKWYPGDWRADPLVRSCTPLARYVWLEMLGLMHEAEPYGHLVLGNRAMDYGTLSRVIAVDIGEVRRAVKELESRGVFSRTDDGVIFSRRMIRDDDKRKILAENGAKGGKSRVTHVQQNHGLSENLLSKMPSKTQAPEARSQIPEEKISSSLRSDDSARSPKPSPRQALLNVLTDEWAEAVLDHRQKLRKPLTAKAAEMLAKAFDATGDPNGAAEMMISRGWQGFKLDWWQNDRTNHGNSAAPPGYGGGAAFQPVSRRNRQEPPSVAEAIMRAGRQRAYPADVSGERADLSRRDGCNGERGGVTIDGAGSVILN